MKKYRSSIFSFDTVSSFLSSPLRAVILAALIVIATDFSMRPLLADLTKGWDYWTLSAADKYLSYAEFQREQQTPRLLFVGDSSADYGISPIVFNQRIGRPRYSYNLATLGNFPFSFDKTINEILLSGPGPYPRFLAISMGRGGFAKIENLRRTELSVLNSAVVRRNEGELPLGDIFALARLWPARQALLRKFRNPSHRLLSSTRGFRARSGGTGAVVTRPKESARFVLDTFRLAVIERTIALCRERGIIPILIHPPVHSMAHLRWENPNEYVDAVSRMARDEDIQFWDYSTDSSYDDFMQDLVHLNDEGARIFSEELANRFLSSSMIDL